MINLNNISLWRGDTVLLEHSNMTLYAGQKTALVGVNGSGKSSLLQLLLGQLQVDAGEIMMPSDWRIAYMAQEAATTERRALDYVMDGDQVLRDIEAALLAAEQQEDGYRLATLHQQLDAIDGYQAPVRAEQLLQGLGFATADIDRPVNHFSGGWRIRLNLAQALMCPADLLLLDEPTNHLDMDAALWLEQWLQRYTGALLMISHDRDFIDAVCDSIVHIEHRQLHSYRGNYSAFERQRSEYLAQQQAMFDKQQRDIAHMQRFIDRFRAKASKARQAQSRIKALERMELIAPAHSDSPFDFSFAEPPRAKDPMLHFSDCQLGYAATLDHAEHIVLRRINLSIHPGSRIGLLGANGAGKSTLVKTLAGELAPLFGERTASEQLRIGYFSQHQLETLDNHASPALHLQRLDPQANEQAIRRFLGGFNFRGDKALQTIEHFSGGEKARLALALIVWQRPNLLLLDEPTNHLDLTMCHALTVALQTFSGAMVLISHDRHLLRNTVDEFILVRDGHAEPFTGDLQDYRQWLLSKNKNKAGVTESKKNVPTNKKQQRQQVDALNKQIANTEKKLAQLAEQLSTVEVALADESLYVTTDNKQHHASDLQKLLKKQSDLQRQHDDLEEQWLVLNQQLETVSNESKITSRFDAGIVVGVKARTGGA